MDIDGVFRTNVPGAPVLSIDKLPSLLHGLIVLVFMISIY